MRIYFAILYLLMTNAAHAQWSSSSGINTPICTASQFQRRPECISDGHGGAIFAWLDSRPDSAYMTAQKVNAAGIPQWNTAGVLIAVIPRIGTVDDSQVELVSDGAGGAIVAFEKARMDSTGIISFDLYAQWIDSSASIRWPDGGVRLAGGENGQITPRMMSDGKGGAILVFSDFRFASPGSIGMYSVQHITSAGVVVWGDNGIPLCNTMLSGTGYGGRLADIVSDGASGAIVVWEDCRYFGTNITFNVDIFAQRVDSSGTLQWINGGVPVSTTPYVQEFPRIVSDGVGGAIISWLDSTKNIMAQRINGFGISQWAANGNIVYRNAGVRLAPTIASDGIGGAIISWSDNRSGSFGPHVYAQHLNDSGALQWGPGGLPICLTPTPNKQNVSNIISDGANGAIITWVNFTNTAGSRDIYAQRVNSAGTVQWNANGVAITNAADDQSAPFLVNAEFGSAIFVWEDFRAGGSANSHIYTQRVNFDGSLGNPATSVNEKGMPTRFELVQNYPNPFNPSTTIQFAVGTYGHISLRVFNLLGQEIATLVNEALNAGTYEVNFNVSGLPSGMYYYKLQSEIYSDMKKMVLVK